MSVTFQRILLGVAALALVALLLEIGFSVAATMHGNTPQRVAHVNAGPYPLTVSLYKDPADAGYSLPLAVAAPASTQGPLSFDVTSTPGLGVDATPVHVSSSNDSNVSMQGVAEITVQGDWLLHIVVNGPQGQGSVDVPITATAPPAIPSWLGWLIGGIPLFGLLIFLLLQRKPAIPELDNSLPA